MEAEKQIDPQLKDVLTQAGAEEYMPVFAKKGVSMKQVSYMHDKELSSVRRTGGRCIAGCIYYTYTIQPDPWIMLLNTATLRSLSLLSRTLVVSKAWPFFCS